MSNHFKQLLRIQKSHIPAVTDTLTQTFQEEPLWKYFIPDDAERRKKVRYLIKFVVRYGINYGEVYATSANMEGALIWTMSDKATMTLSRQIQCGAIAVALRMGLRLTLKQIKANGQMSAAHQRLTPFPHIYLTMLGIKPQFQRQGYASQLLRPLCQQCDELALPCFLETHVDENIPLYQHFGFQVLDESTFPDSPLKNIPMLRQPTA